MGAALAKTARQDDAVHAFENIERARVVIEFFGVDQADGDLDVIGDPAMAQRLGDRFISVRHVGILADKRHADFAVRIVDRLRNPLPARQVRLRRVGDPEVADHFLVETFGVVGRRHVIDVPDVARLDDAGGTHVAEAGDLALLVLGNRPVAAAQQDLWLDADRAQFLDGVLGRLGLHLAGGRDVRQQRQVDEASPLRAEFLAELANGLEEGQALDIADRAADFAQHEINARSGIGQDEILDLVGDVRNDLDRRAEIVAAALFLDDAAVDAPGRDVVGLAGGHAREALIVAEIEVGLGAVISDVDFAVLTGAHRAGVNVEIGVKLAQTHAVAA